MSKVGGKDFTKFFEAVNPEQQRRMQELRALALLKPL
jgi:hypothetical protein